MQKVGRRQCYGFRRFRTASAIRSHDRSTLLKTTSRRSNGLSLDEFSSKRALDMGCQLSSRSCGEGLDGLEFLGVLTLDLMDGEGILQIEPELLGGSEIPG